MQTQVYKLTCTIYHYCLVCMGNYMQSCFQQVQWLGCVAHQRVNETEPSASDLSRILWQ